MESYSNNEKELKINAFPSIQRKMIIEGKMIPAFICNGGSYFYTNLEVYSDGIIDTWGAVDLDIFQEKLKSNWVATSIPEGKDVSIHHLGNLRIKNCSWRFDKKSFYNFILETIKEMNPDLQNLYDFHGTDTIKRGEANYAKLSKSKGKPTKPKYDEFPFLQKLEGQNFPAFIESEDFYYLCNISVFEDETIIIDRIPEVINTDLEGLKRLIEESKLITEIEKDKKVVVYGFGEFEIEKVNYVNNIKSVLSEIGDTISELNSRPTTSQMCKIAYDDYLKTPTVKLRNELKRAYENVPEHLRTYVLGDMDVKDIPVRMIIYGEEEMKMWSHYIIAETEGDELPEIVVPKPKDENKV